MKGFRHIRRQSRGVATAVFAALALSGCLTSDETEVAQPVSDQMQMEISGSVGDGPIVGAAMRILARDGALLAEIESSSTAEYSLSLESDASQFPLIIEARSGTDLVTNATPDFLLRSAVLQVTPTATANLTPYSTIAWEIAAAMSGGPNRDNLLLAESIAVTELNFGLDTFARLSPTSTAINTNNVAEIVRASEALGETIRRTRDWLAVAGISFDGDGVLRAVASDLVDEVLDGRGGPAADGRISALFSAVSAQVSLELMANELHVNEADATAVMTDAIQTVSGPGSQTLDQLSATAGSVYQAQIGLAAVAAISDDPSIRSIHEATMLIQSGLGASLVKGLLPSDYRVALDSALLQIATGNSDIVETVNTTVRNGDPSGSGNGGGEGNAAPMISGTPPSIIEVDTNYAFTPTASDPDGDTLTFSANGLPDWLSLNDATGEIQGTPASQDVGTASGIAILVSDGTDSALLGPFAIEVTAAPLVNQPPSISGSPSDSVTVNSQYEFRPTASDPDGDALVFSVQNLPEWATFNANNGRIRGTPDAGDVNTYSGIEIAVSDGEFSRSLGPFSVTVVAISAGSATLTWTAPTENTDGTPLTNLAGYRLYWGRNGSYSKSVTIDNPGVTTYFVDGLEPGTWTFVSTAFNSEGIESQYSQSASKTIQ